MSIATMLTMSKLDNATVQRLGDVLMIAVEYNEMGVVDWVARAASDARAFGKLRDRDAETLTRLERKFRDSDFYRRIDRRDQANSRVGRQAAGSC